MCGILRVSSSKPVLLGIPSRLEPLKETCQVTRRTCGVPVANHRYPSILGHYFSAQRLFLLLLPCSCLHFFSYYLSSYPIVPPLPFFSVQLPIFHFFPSLCSFFLTLSQSPLPPVSTRHMAFFPQSLFPLSVFFFSLSRTCLHPLIPL